jgi:hypothetical protein
MTTSKFDPDHPFEAFALETNRTRLLLSAHEVVIRKSGLEFLSPQPLPMWTEVSITLRSPSSERPLRGNGVVVDCTGSRHTGYTVSLLLLDLSPQSQQHLRELALASAS